LLPPERLSVADAFRRYAGIDLLATLPGGAPDRAALAAAAQSAGVRGPQVIAAGVSAFAPLAPRTRSDQVQARCVPLRSFFVIMRISRVILSENR